VRIEAARKKLECSRAPVSEITWQISYVDSRSFGRFLKRRPGFLRGIIAKKYFGRGWLDHRWFLGEGEAEKV
jgi:hypothetical protein